MAFPEFLAQFPLYDWRLLTLLRSTGKPSRRVGMTCTAGTTAAGERSGFASRADRPTDTEAGSASATA